MKKFFMLLSMSPLLCLGGCSNLPVWLNMAEQEAQEIEQDFSEAQAVLAPFLRKASPATSLPQGAQTAGAQAASSK